MDHQQHVQRTTDWGGPPVDPLVNVVDQDTTETPDSMQSDCILQLLLHDCNLLELDAM